jgi:hypothetical protein
VSQRIKAAKAMLLSFQLPTSIMSLESMVYMLSSYAGDFHCDPKNTFSSFVVHTFITMMYQELERETLRSFSFRQSERPTITEEGISMLYAKKSNMCTSTILTV